jgi:hypothetical protein
MVRKAELNKKTIQKERVERDTKLPDVAPIFGIVEGAPSL